MCIRSKSFFFASTGVVALAASLAMASTAMATTTGTTTIISDTFPTSQGVGSGAYLQGSTPDGVDLPGSTWTTNYYGGKPAAYSAPTSAEAPFIEPNSAVYFPAAPGGNVSAAIAFTPTGNGVLSLTATLDWAGGEWLGMGFANSVTTASPTQAGPWMLVADTVQMFGESGGKNFVPTTGVASGPNTVTFTYDPVAMVETVTVSNATNGSDYIDASEPLSYFGITTAPTIGSIFFGTRSGTGTNGTNGSNFSNVTLTQGPAQVVPDAAPAALLGLGGVAGLLLLGRRRKLA